MGAAVRLGQDRSAHSVARLPAVRLVLLVVLCSPAAASDVVINYAVDAEGKTGSGKLDSCGYDSVCRSRATDLDVDIVVRPSTTTFATLDMIVRGGPDCCYTRDAEQKFQSRINPGPMHFAIYRRKRSSRDDFVMNDYSWFQ
ncbi:hypothetical protein ACVIJ6_004416 [Bradyrhizobium sp. USDA 4369]